VNRSTLGIRVRGGVLKGLPLRTKVFFLFAGAALAIVVPALLLIANAVEQRAYSAATEALQGAAAQLENGDVPGGDLAVAAEFRAHLNDVVDAWSRGQRRTLYNKLHAGLDRQFVLAADTAFRPLLSGPPRIDPAALRGVAEQGSVVVLPDTGPPLRMAVVQVKRDTARHAPAGADTGRVEAGRDTFAIGYLGIGVPVSAAAIRKDIANPRIEVALVVGDSLAGTTFSDSIAPEVRAFLQHGGLRQQAAFRGETYLWRRYRLPSGGVPTTVVLFRRVTDELAIASGIKQSLFGIGLAALVLALVLAALVARIVARPAQALAVASQRLARGDYAAPLPRDSGDEIGQLARAFGEMRAAIGEREQRLRSAQAEMIHREKLAAMGRLVAQLSHEINNPIYNIQNCLEALERRGDPADPNREFLTLAQEELARMATLTRQLLDQSRPLSDAAQPMSLNGMVQRVLTLAAPQLSEHGVRIATNLDPRLPEVVVHPDGVQQVLANLVENAGDAMPDGGTLTVTTREVGEAVEVVVEDTGTGIAERDLPHIFEAFYTTKPGVAGIGLGLFVSEGIIRGHRGRLSVESTFGKGSRFTVRLPRETMDEAMHEPPSPTAAPEAEVAAAA
jgi:signal transduction histidine kinase